LAGISVYVHWSWFLVALYSIQYRTHEYSSMVFNALEYLSLFAIVLIHEYGHQLACRQVGGKTHDIVLWPLGGVAYVSPPERPGAQLWSIAAGPLVNVILAPCLLAIVGVLSSLDWQQAHPDAYALCRNITFINIALLIFNLLPVYPLDGGQILRSILWFMFGRANSLMVVSVLGFVGVAGLILIALWSQSIWIGIMAFFLVLNCWRGLIQARILGRVAKLPRRRGFACPSCRMPPPIGAYWLCDQCRNPFDTFLTNATCPHCHAQFDTTRCLDCGESTAMSLWTTSSARSSP
jgi:Zn-dependent protease